MCLRFEQGQINLHVRVLMALNTVGNMRTLFRRLHEISCNSVFSCIVWNHATNSVVCITEEIIIVEGTHRDGAMEQATFKRWGYLGRLNFSWLGNTL